MRTGSIYKVENTFNGKIYIGQTCRDPDIRFQEHKYYADRRNTPLHAEIFSMGEKYFKFSTIEAEIPLEQLDARERHWIDFHDTLEKGYNHPLGPAPKRPYNQILVVEKGVVFDSIYSMVEMFSTITSWTPSMLKRLIKRALDGGDFLGYQLKELTQACVSDPCELEDWIKAVNQRFLGMHIRCEQLNKDFATTEEAAKYLIQHDPSQLPPQSPLTTLMSKINKNLKEKIDDVGGFVFEYYPGAAKEGD